MKSLLKFNIIILIVLVLALVGSTAYLFFSYIIPGRKNLNEDLGSGKACTLLFSVKKRDLKNVSVACNNFFLNNEDNEQLTENSKLKPDNLVKIRILLNNTGEVPLDGLSVESPLDDTYAHKGALNLNWLKFMDFADTSSAEIKNKCTYSENFNSIQCTNLSIPYTEELYIDYIVKVNQSILSDSEIVNVSKAFVEGTGIDYFCNSSIKTAQISSVCNNSTQSCEKVYRAPLPGENTCTNNTDCGGVQSETHLECFEEACVSVSGAASSTCSVDSDCVKPSHLGCKNSSCALIEGPGANTCASDLDCSPQTHLECRNSACTLVSGLGTNMCSTDEDCLTENHLECIENACTTVAGAGKNLCSTNSDCEQATHLECVLESCMQVTGGGSNQCASDSDCATNVTLPSPDPSVDPNQDLPATGVSGILMGSVISIFGVVISFLLYKYTLNKRKY